MCIRDRYQRRVRGGPRVGMLLLARRALQVASKARFPRHRFQHGFPTEADVLGTSCTKGFDDCEGPRVHTVGKPGPNHGRTFQSCGKQEGGCGLFAWQDNDGQGPNCNCGNPSISRTVKKETSPNLGRYFWVCGKPREEQCDFFAWFQDTPAAAAPSPLPAVLCHCLQPGVQRTVMKPESPNKGKLFWVCGKSREEQCGFFEWSEESTEQLSPPSFPGVNSSPGF
eukprot:TRINITY_DN5147_c0_g1_i1.p1 TRINITY_DN5147_c0_g1~~TRINITY_DN5147_c0_g1_i1.p1  ORF type:complete len:225 (+),score=26.65 TRINITY_DN5147_c0_g1_i1:124-798(+)